MRNINRALLTAAMVCCAMTLKPVVRAEGDASTKSATDATKPAGGGERGERFRERMKELSEKLGLTEEQKEKLKPIFHAEMEKLKELRADTKSPRGPNTTTCTTS